MKKEDIKKGMIVRFSKEVIFTRSWTNSSRDMTEVWHPGFKVGIVMGLTNKITGYWVQSTQEDSGFISDIETHKVVVIQIMPGQQKYYLPIYVFPEDIEQYEA